MSQSVHFIKATKYKPNHVKQKYDYIIQPDLFSASQNTGASQLLSPGHRLLYEYIKNKSKDTKVAIIGFDCSISIPCIKAIKTRAIKNSEVKFLWIGRDPYLDANLDDFGALNGIIGQCILGNIDVGIPGEIKSDDILYYGIDKEHVGILNDHVMTFYTEDKIKAIGIKNMIITLKNRLDNIPIYITLDLNVFDGELYPKQSNSEKKGNVGLHPKYVLPILKALHKNIIGINICGIDIDGSNENVKKRRELARECLINAFDLKEKKINIFTEDSAFLIYRPLCQSKKYPDFGWYVASKLGVDINDMDKIIKSIDSDTMICLDIDGEDYLIAKTTMRYQNSKTYYTTTKIEDLVLFPDEKAVMCFDLLGA